MDEFEQIAINSTRENWLGYGFPAYYNSEIHGSKDLLSGTLNESLSGIANCMHKVRNSLTSNCGTASLESASCSSVEWNCLVSKPYPVVKLLDTIIATSHRLLDWSVTSLWMICELEWQCGYGALCGSFFKQINDNFIFASH